MKNTNRAIKEYSEAVKQAKSVYNQAVKRIEGNYIKGSSVYKDAMKTAKETFDEAVMDIKKVYVKMVKEDFEETRTAIKNIVVTAPSKELLEVLPIIKEGNLTETELQMFTEKFVGSYMDEKLLADATGEQFKTIENMVYDLNTKEGNLTETELQMFTEKFVGSYMDEKLLADATGEQFKTIENMVYDLNTLESEVNDFFDNYTGRTIETGLGYKNATMMNGSPVELMNKTVDEFLTRYAGQE